MYVFFCIRSGYRIEYVLVLQAVVIRWISSIRNCVVELNRGGRTVSIFICFAVLFRESIHCAVNIEICMYIIKDARTHSKDCVLLVHLRSSVPSVTFVPSVPSVSWRPSFFFFCVAIIVSYDSCASRDENTNFAHHISHNEMRMHASLLADVVLTVPGRHDVESRQRRVCERNREVA